MSALASPPSAGRNALRVAVAALVLSPAALLVPAAARGGEAKVTLNLQDEGYRGIWYMNQPSGDEYAYKYSGGLGTYCAKHQPFAVYCLAVERTFFCWGGTAKDSYHRLLHMASWFDHRTRTVPRPTIVLDKETGDAHDNPVISADAEGHIWIFSTSHGRSRPSFIHRSREPYSIEAFELVRATRREGERSVPFTNFSYLQVWPLPEGGFAAFLTRYGDPAPRTIGFMTSRDGVAWNAFQRLAVVDERHYQVSAVERSRAGSAFNYHPRGKGLNWRTNLYYVETEDLGETWQAAGGREVEVPLRAPRNAALVHDYGSEGLNVYLKDLRYDGEGRPVILFLTSRGYRAGPAGDPRVWRTARWSGSRWEIREAFRSDSNYDMGSLWIEPGGAWRIVAPTEPGPQPYNPGGDMVLWESEDQGRSWRRLRQLTGGGARNHGYARRPLRAHADFYAFWADGHGRRPSPSDLYFCDHPGNVYRLPRRIEGQVTRPEPLPGPGRPGRDE